MSHLKLIIYSIDSVGFAPLEVLKKYVENKGHEKLNDLRQTQEALHPDPHRKR